MALRMTLSDISFWEVNMELRWSMRECTQSEEPKTAAEKRTIRQIGNDILAHLVRQNEYCHSLIPIEHQGLSY